MEVAAPAFLEQAALGDGQAGVLCHQLASVLDRPVAERPERAFFQLACVHPVGLQRPRHAIELQQPMLESLGRMQIACTDFGRLRIELEIGNRRAFRQRDGANDPAPQPHFRQHFLAASGTVAQRLALTPRGEARRRRLPCMRSKSIGPGSSGGANASKFFVKPSAHSSRRKLASYTDSSASMRSSARLEMPASYASMACVMPAVSRHRANRRPSSAICP